MNNFFAELKRRNVYKVASASMRGCSFRKDLSSFVQSAGSITQTKGKQE
jgi:hypothetical protein